MFRNIHYDNKKGEITEQTWDEEGNRITVTEKFKPLLLVESQEKTKYPTVYGTYCKSQSFKNTWDRKEFEKSTNKRLYFNLPPDQQYAILKYRETPSEDFVKNPVRTFFLDIECPSPDSFPEPAEAKHEIDLMTIYDSLDSTYYMWGKREWDKEGWREEIEKLGGDIIIPENVVYYQIEDERKRLLHMLDFWNDRSPDIITHFNGKSFDMPYIVNRLKLLFRDDTFKKLSPINVVRTRSGFDKFNNPEENVSIMGLSDMDYMDVFKVFTMNAERAEWSLNSVAEDVLGCGKITFGQGNLYELSQTDWGKYCAYNLVDVALLVSIDAKREYLPIARETAYRGFSNPVDALGKLKTISGAICFAALKEGKMMETKRVSENTSFEGGFVLPPQVGLKTNILSVDIKSLYPSNMWFLNTSPECKMGKFDEEHVLVFRDLEGGSHTFNSVKQKYAWLDKKRYCISEAGVVFRQDFEGIVTKFVVEQFNNKEKYGDLQKQALKNGDYAAAADYGRKREIAKVFANSVYGAISSFRSAIYDIDLARSVTLTGQAVIKKAHQILNDFGREKFGIDEDIVVASDTDSAMITLSPLLAKHGLKLFDLEGKLTKNGNDFCNVFGKLLNTEINKWCREKFRMKSPNYIFEREKVASAAMFFGKKQYAYHVNNNEGIDLPLEKRQKYTGLKVIKSEYSPMVKRMMNELYHETLANFEKQGSEHTRKQLSNIVKRHRKEFFEGSFFDVSKRQKANSLNYDAWYVSRYETKAVDGNGVPAHSKSAINHNRLIEDHKLESRYPILKGGAKVMWVYTKPENINKIECVAGSGGILPPEFGLEIDYEKQFETLYMKAYEQIFDTIGWRKPNLHFEEETDLFELFS